jgi:hypothetical protein
MNRTSAYCTLISFILLLMQASLVEAISTEELAHTCKVMESAISEISLEYDWYNIPAWTIKELKDETGIKEVLVPKEGLRRFKLSASGLLIKRDPNDPNRGLPERLALEISETLVDEDGKTWDSIVKQAYNGKVFKTLRIGSPPQDYRIGSISQQPAFMLRMSLTPIGFSVLRRSMSEVPGDRPLSTLLEQKEFVHLDNTLQEVNGFNTIRADFLGTTNKIVHLRTYFSLEHGYTPVRYEYMAGQDCVGFTVDVHSLEKVRQGFWFPIAGVISRRDDKRADAYIATSKILVNQGLADKHFDIDFPPGTKVWDRIKGIQYTIKSN